MKHQHMMAALLLVLSASVVLGAPVRKPSPAASQPKRKPAPAPSPADRLWKAVEKGDLPTARMLLENGGDVSLLRNERTLLALAAEKGWLDLCRLLLERGAKVDPDQGYVPLYLAIGGKHSEVVRLLVERGADPNQQPEGGAPPLVFAAANNLTAMIALLLDLGAKPSVEALVAAAEAKAVEAATVLLDRGVPVDGANAAGEPPLFSAIHAKSEPIVALLLKRGAKLESRDAEGLTPLMRAVERGSLPVAALLIKAGAEVNAKDPDGRTPLKHAVGDNAAPFVALLKQAGAKEIAPTLMEAVRQEDSRAVRELLDRGADPNAPDEEGRTPLFFGVRDAVIAKALLDKGANPNARDKKGRTVFDAAKEARDRESIELLLQVGVVSHEFELVKAVEAGDITAVQKALSLGADANTADERGTPVLLTAYSLHGEERPEITLLLLERGASPAKKGELGSTILHLAASRGDTKLAKELLERGADPNARAVDGSTPFSEAFSYDEPLLRLLLERGASAGNVDNFGRTPLMTHVGAIKPDLARLMLEKGGLEVLNAADEQGETALFSAARTANAPVVKLLLERGARPNAQNRETKQTALFPAVHAEDDAILAREGENANPSVSRLETVKLLLRAGVDPNVVNVEGKTALQYARSLGRQDLVKALSVSGGKDAPKVVLSASERFFAAVRAGDVATVTRMRKSGVNPNSLDKDHYTPLYYAARLSGLPMVKLLIAHGAKPNYHPGEKGGVGPSPLWAATFEGRLDVCRYLLSKGANVNAVFAGTTPLEEAIRGDNVALCKLLLESGATVKMFPGVRVPPLTQAASFSTPEICRLLLGKGADPNEPMDDGETALMWVASKGKIEMVRLLLKAGADPNRVSKKGNTALIRSALDGNLEVIKLLLASGADVNVKNQGNETALSLAQDRELTEIVDLLLRARAKK